MTPTCRFLTLFGGLGANCSTSIHGRTTTHRKQRSPPRDCLYACLYYFTKHSPHYSFTHAVAVNMVDLLNESDQLFSHFFNITFLVTEIPFPGRNRTQKNHALTQPNYKQDAVRANNAHAHSTRLLR